MTEKTKELEAAVEASRADWYERAAAAGVTAPDATETGTATVLEAMLEAEQGVNQYGYNGWRNLNTYVNQINRAQSEKATQEAQVPDSWAALNPGADWAADEDAARARHETWDWADEYGTTSDHGVDVA